MALSLPSCDSSTTVKDISTLRSLHILSATFRVLSVDALFIIRISHSRSSLTFCLARYCSVFLRLFSPLCVQIRTVTPFLLYGSIYQYIFIILSSEEKQFDFII